MRLNNKWVKFFIIINFLGALYGFVFFYGNQLMNALAKPWALLFIPDCPLFALLMGVALLFVLQGKKKDAFYFFVFAGSIKYSLWTLAVLLAFTSYYFQQDFLLYALLFMSHIGLLLESLILLGRFNFNQKAFLLTLAFFLLNDFFDYFLGTHPPLPPNVLMEMFPFTLGLSMAAIIVTVWLALKAKKEWVKIR